MPIPFILGAVAAAFTTAEVVALVVAAFTLGALLSSGTKDEIYVKIKESGFEILALFIELINEKTFAIIKKRLNDNNNELSEKENIVKIIEVLEDEAPTALQTIEQNIDKKINEIDEIYDNQMLENLKELKELIYKTKMSR